MITTLFIAFLLLFESNNEVNGSREPTKYGVWKSSHQTSFLIKKAF